MKNLLIVLALLSGATSHSQVPKTTVVEHFTNSLCGICASKNPGFYENLSNFPEAIHLAYHPSAPYEDCVFHQHNPDENDGRTNYYDAYGGTPRFVVNGILKASSANASSASLLSAHSAETSSYSLQLSQEWVGNFDSVALRVVITREAADGLTSASLFVGLAESLIDYDAPNGETEHHDVFRKSTTGFSGTEITLPDSVGDTVAYRGAAAYNADWSIDELYGFAILNETNSRSVLQATSGAGSAIAGVSPQAAVGCELGFYPNPSQGLLWLKAAQPATIEIYTVSGQRVLSTAAVPGESVNVGSLSVGIYTALLRAGKEARHEMLVIQ